MIKVYGFCDAGCKREIGLRSLGRVTGAPTNPTSEFFNSVTDEGLYIYESLTLIPGLPAKKIYNYCLMSVDSDLGVIKQTIINLNTQELCVRERALSSTEWTVKNDALATHTFVAEQVGSKHLYEHNLRLNSTWNENELIMNLRIITNSNTAITKDTIKNYFPTQTGEVIVATGTLGKGTDVEAITCITKENDNYLINLDSRTNLTGTLVTVTAGYELFETNMTIKDFVRQIY